MSLHFEQELGELKQKLLAMARQAASNVTGAVQSLTERNAELAKQVEADDAILDQFEKDIDELAVILLAKAPLASQLRLITVAMKASHDLERVGDEATTIARRALELNAEEPCAIPANLPSMARRGLQMLEEAIDAFVHHDAAKARRLIPQDKDIDALNKQLQHDLAQQMAQQPSSIRRCLNLMTVAKSLERIADHATNIAEEAVYLQEGADIRHDPELKRAKQGPDGR
jgi:phosphate transport system protein